MRLITKAIERWKQRGKKKNRMRLTMKAIIRWEQLNKKPFSLLDYTNEDEIVSLFYVCHQPDEIKISLEEFRQGLKKKDAKSMVEDFQRQTSLAAQFQTAPKNKGKETTSTQEATPPYLKEIVPLLVMNGLDVRFALNDMELCDLPVFLQAYDVTVKNRLTEQRLWTYLQLSPHMERGKTPKDMYPFDWEKEEESISEDELEAGKGESVSFLKTGLKV